MKFETWWDTLTPKEQNVIGLNNARFVWTAASNAFAKQCEQQAEHALQAHNPECAWRLATLGTQIASSSL